jgi:Ca-activated chloride channel family protein
VDDLKYQTTGDLSEAAQSNELLTLKLRYKLPDEDQSKLFSAPVEDSDAKFGAAGRDFQFAAAVASFGMLLRNSEHKGNATYDAVLEIAQSAAGEDDTYRAEFLAMVKRAGELSR